MTSGPVVVDCAALQSPTSRGRGIGRFARQWADALEALRPDLVGRYLLDPLLPPPGELEALLATGKVAYRDDAALPAGARIYHCLSPLDTAVRLATLRPRAAVTAGLIRSATVYDLIPALAPERELRDPFERLRYQHRLELVRSTDHIQVLSEKVARDVTNVLSFDPEKVLNVGAAPGDSFHELVRHDEAAPLDERLVALGVRKPFVLYPTGSHPRKNNETLLDAWARLGDEQRASTKLVLVGDLPTSMAHHFRHVAEGHGYLDSLVVTGVVEDEILLELYRSATLVCFASLDEGFGLPVAEALALEVPVIGSERSPLDEQLPAAARFDPCDPSAIAAAIERCLDDKQHRARLLAASVRPRSSLEVAKRCASGFDALLAPERGAGPSSGIRARTRAPARRRLAVVTPLPPTPSGVAAYSFHLLEALEKGFDLALDVYCDGPTADQHAPNGVTVRDLSLFAETERLVGGYDEVLYTLGNSHYHYGALSLLRRRSGAVLAHDVRLVNLYRYEAGLLGLGDGLAGSISAMYGPEALPEGVGATGVTTDEEERFGLLMAREAITASTLFLVSSFSSAALAQMDAGPRQAAKVGVLPFAFASTASEKAFDDDGSGSDPAQIDALLAHEGPMLSSFGIVDRAKRPVVLVEAAATLVERFPGLHVAFVGLASDAITEELQCLANSLGIGDAVTVTGAVATRDYQRVLNATTVAVQLRNSSNGEASAAVGECLAAGLPTVVSDVGWARELPEDAVARLARLGTSEQLARVLEELLGDEERRAELSRRATRIAEHRRFSMTARALVEQLFTDSLR